MIRVSTEPPSARLLRENGVRLGWMLVCLFSLYSNGLAQDYSLFQGLEIAYARDIGVQDKLLKLSSATWLSIDQPQLQRINQERPGTLNLSIPLDADQDVQLDLKRVNLFSPDARAVLASQKPGFPLANTGVFYYGEIVEQATSMVAIAVFDQEIMGVLSYGGHTFNLEHVRSPHRRDPGVYLLYNEQDAPIEQVSPCADVDVVAPSGPAVDEPTRFSKDRAAGPIEIFLECDYQMFLDHQQSAQSVVNFTTGLFNVVAGIFRDAGGSDQGPVLTISEILIWDTPDPYQVGSAFSSLAVLDAFTCTRSSYNGRIAHLLSTANGSLGGIASRPSCSNGNYTGSIHGFSNIHNAYNSNLNQYSWSVNLLTHELGHNMSSPHTHACAWNGNNTQIDDCGNSYLDQSGQDPEACYDEGDPIIPAQGTIMSYCHLSTGNGINLAQGFHPQVAVRINEFAACISNEVACFTASQSDMHIEQTSSSSARLHCDLSVGPDYYYWMYREVGTMTWNTSPQMTTLPYYDVNSLLSGTNYEFTVLLYCSGEGWGGYACPQPFQLGSGDCPPVLELAQVPIPAGIYSASQSIMAGGQIMNSSTVTLKAGQEIRLDPGFSVDANSTMEIRINQNGCN